MGPVIVDKSVWINGLRGVQTNEVELVARYIATNQNLYITSIILQEVLQGVREDNRYQIVKEGMLAQTILILDPIEAAIEAATLYRTLRKKGVTIRKPNDCLIAHYAIFYDIYVLNNDIDFDQIARFTALRVAKA